MKKPLPAASAYGALILGLLLSLAAPAYCDDTVEGTVELDGTIVGSDTDGYAKKYNGDYKLTAKYKIVTTTDANGKKVLDTSKSTVILTGKSNRHQQTTNSIPITNVTWDGTGKVTSFEYSGDNWYTPAGQVDESKISGKVTRDSTDPKKGTGTSEASYKGKQSGLTRSYSFTSGTTSPPGTPKTGTADSKIEEKKSIEYAATTGILSIHEDSIISAPFATDPIVGATLTFPDFHFTGFSFDERLAVFWPTDNTPYVMAEDGSIYQKSVIPFLFYDMAENLFYATLSDTVLAGVSPGSPFYDPSLPNISSPFLSSLDSILNSNSILFDPDAYLYLTITPNVDFGKLTAKFTLDLSTGGDDGQLAAHPTPEPSTLVLLGLGLGGLLVCRLRRNHWPPPCLPIEWVNG
jgi:hypothetical protein